MFCPSSSPGAPPGPWTRRTCRMVTWQRSSLARHRIAESISCRVFQGAQERQYSRGEATTGSTQLSNQRAMRLLSPPTSVLPGDSVTALVAPTLAQPTRHLRAFAALRRDGQVVAWGTLGKHQMGWRVLCWEGGEGGREGGLWLGAIRSCCFGFRSC